MRNLTFEIPHLLDRINFKYNKTKFATFILTRKYAFRNSETQKATEIAITSISNKILRQTFKNYIKKLRLRKLQVASVYI